MYQVDNKHYYILIVQNAISLCWAITGTMYIRQLPRYTEREKKKAEKHVLLPRLCAVVHSNVIALVSAPFQSVPLAHEKKEAFRSFRYSREYNTWSRGGRFFFFDTTRRIIQLRPSRQRGGGVSDTAPSPKRHTNSYIKPNTGDGREPPPPLL